MDTRHIIQQENSFSSMNAIDDKLLLKLKESFTETQQQLFLQSFVMYLNHNQEKDFVIDLDNVYEWIGFKNKHDCKKLLLKHFKEKKDFEIYKGFARENLDRAVGEARFSNETHGGQNKETILLTIKTFKKLCMKASTKKADEIHDYYIKMEEILHEYVKETHLEEKKHIENETKSRTLIEQYSGKNVIYLVFIRAFLEFFIVKYGITQNVSDTLMRHRDTYGKQVYYLCIIECENRDKIERKIQTHTDLISRHIKEYENKPRKELLRLDRNFGLENLIELIKKLIEASEPLFCRELLLAKELTKQKELDNIKYQEETKQKELDNIRYRLELEYNLKVKKMEFELEMRNNIQRTVVTNAVVENDIRINENVTENNVRMNENENDVIINENENDVIINENDVTKKEKDVVFEFMRTQTIFSNYESDRISSQQLEDKFVVWVEQRILISKLKIMSYVKQFPNIIYKPKITIDSKKQPGITHRKFVNE